MARILVVDDHPHIVRLVQRELQQEGHEVLTAADGEEALEAVRREQPALVILDVVMPKKNGYEVLREMREHPETRTIPVILLTVKDQPTDVTHGLQLGADWHLSKPFCAGEVAALARRFLELPPS
jgi:DNA-binding response OmpR family regulator